MKKIEIKDNPLLFLSAYFINTIQGDGPAKLMLNSWEKSLKHHIFVDPDQGFGKRDLVYNDENRMYCKWNFNLEDKWIVDR